MFFAMMRKYNIRQGKTFIPVFLICFVYGLNYAWFASNYKFFRGPNTKISLTDKQLSLVASVIHFGRLVTPVIMMLIDRSIGRKPVLILSVIFMLTANSMLLATKSPLVLQMSRIISGVAIGLGDSVMIIYVGEVSSEYARGLYCAFSTSSFFSGILAEYVVTVIFNYTSSTVALIIVNVITLISCSALVESPYHLVVKNQPTLAVKTIRCLWNANEEQAVNRLSQICQNLEQSQNGRFFQLIQQRAVYKSLTIATCYGIITSIINVTIIANANLIIPSSEMLSSEAFAIIFISLSTIAVALSAIFVHNFGRKTLLTWSFTIEILFYTLIAALFLLDQKSILYIPCFAWAMFVIISISHFIFQLGIHSTTIAIRSEIYPHNFKIIANNVSILCNAGTNFISTYSFLYFKEEIGMYMNFITFLLADLVGLFITVSMLPETKGKTLEEIQKMLEEPNKGIKK